MDTIIRSRTRRRILVKMLLAPDREFYLRELARSTGAALRTEGIDLAFVFGSMAEGTAKSDSDVDVLIVGDLGLREAVRRLAAAQERLGREINPVVWTREEFERRQKSGDHFLSRIVAGSRLIIMGEGSDLAAVDG